MRSFIQAALALPAAGCLLLSACGGGGGGDPAPQSATLSVSVTGLASNSSFELSNSNGDRLTVDANGDRTFTTGIPSGGSYSVSVTRQPDGQVCSLAAGTGTGSGVVAPAKVQITCAVRTYVIGGKVNGLSAGETVSLLNNNGDETVVSANGAFSFGQPIALHGSYVVTVGKQPVSQTCSVIDGALAGVAAPVDNITVTCSARVYWVKGVVDGLPPASQVTLRLNGSEAVTVNANGPFGFTWPVAHNGSAVTTIDTVTPGVACSVANGNIAGVVSTVEGVAVHCAAVTLPVSATVTGLPAGQSVTVYLNGAAPKTVGNGPFTFDTPLPFSGQYQVTTAPMTGGMMCSVRNGFGSGVTAPVTNVDIVCDRQTFPVGGNLYGLRAGRQITLFNNGADPLTLTADGRFSFPARVTYGASYAVTISMQPVNHFCTVWNGSGTNLTQAVEDMSVNCSPTGFTVGGQVSGLAAGRQLTLLVNGADPLTVTANGDFQMPRAVAAYSPYAITVGTEPIGQTCSVTAGTGSSINADTTAVRVNCRDGGSVGGSIKGLGALSGLTIANGSNAITVPANASSFTLPRRLASGDAYNLTVQSQPVSQDPDVVSTVSCSVSGGAGTMGGSDLTNVQVVCGGTLTFRKAGASTWQVPAGISQVSELVVTGAGGSSRAAIGGSGAAVTVTGMAVAPGSVLALEIGVPGDLWQLSGGGASAVTLQGATAPFVIAGGGGAAGNSDFYGMAGSGGDADTGSGGRSGGFGSFSNSPGTSVSGGSGGAGGTGGSGGLGQFSSSGSSGGNSVNGGIAAGGPGGLGRAGGGGAGYGGGGGGGASSGNGSWTGAGGGGGGSLIPAGASAASANNAVRSGISTGQGSVQIRY